MAIETALPSAAVKRKGPSIIVNNEALKPAQRRIAWSTALGPALGTLAALGHAFIFGFGWLELGMLVVGCLLAQCAIEVGVHRLLTHNAFSTYSWVRYAFAIGGSMCAQGRIIHWVANHRRHHAFSDVEEDPHSPWVRTIDGRVEKLASAQVLKGLWHAHLGHMMTDDMPNCTLFARDIYRDPVLRKINDSYGVIIILGLLIPAAIGAAITAPAGMEAALMGAVSGFLWGGVVRIFLVQQCMWSIASFSHMFGQTEFETKDQSKNLFWTGLPSFGSGWQNNHHAFPTSAYLGLHWWQIDFGAWTVKLLRAGRLAWDVKYPTPEQMAAKRIKVPV